MTALSDQMRRFNPEPPKCVFCDLRCHNQAELIEHQRECRLIVVTNDCPPIPVRELDWSAHLADYDAGDAVGTGATRDQAIADLKQQTRKEHE